MRYIVILCCFCLFSFLSYAQTKGKILDGKTLLGLEGVNIYIFKDTLGIGITNEKGEFDLQMFRHCLDNDTIVFSYIGYQTLKCGLKKLKENDYQVLLFEASQCLGEVNITAKRRSYFLDFKFVSTMPKRLFSFGSFLLGHKLYIVAGDETKTKLNKLGMEYWEYRSSNIYVYDIERNLWETKKYKVEDRACHAAHFYNNRIFILGGVRYSTNRRMEYTDEKMEMYDLTKDTLYVESVNPHPAKNFTSLIYDNLLFVIGGSSKKNVFWDKIHALDLKRGYWYEIGDIPEKMQREMNGILVGHNVYFFGGKRTIPLWDINSYNLLTGEWKSLCDLKEAVSYPALVTHNNLIFIYEYNTLQVYNVSTNMLYSYPINLELEYSSMHYYDSKLYIVGGCRTGGFGTVHPTAKVVSVDVSQLYKD